MKQFITIKEASNQLNKINYRTLVEWLDDKKYIDRYYDTGDEVLMAVGIPFTKNKQGGDYAFMTIGQMIEFLSQDTLNYILAPNMVGECEGFVDKDILCDVLWSEVKEVLNK